MRMHGSHGRGTHPRDVALERVAIAGGLLLLALAVRAELRKPPYARDLHGYLFGWIPYDFRVPTIERLRRTHYAPNDPRLLVPRTFGLGWAVNLARVRGLAVEVWRTRGATRP